MYNNPFTGQASGSSGHREGVPHRAVESLNTQSALGRNGQHPTHSMGVLSPISPASGYFDEQGGRDTTQNFPIPLQTHSPHSVESSSSKQIRL